MEHFLFPEIDPVKRAQMLADNCDAAEEKGFTRRFTAEELAEMKTGLSEVDININDVEIEKKQVTDGYNARLKPMKNERTQLLGKLKNKAEYVKEECYKFIDQEKAEVGFYNCDGELIESRPIMPNERQKTIFNINKAQ